MSERLPTFARKSRSLGLDAFLVYSDVNRNYLSRFTGTSGAVLVLGRQAQFITDSRYTLQAKRQVKGAKLQTHRKALLGDLCERLKAAKAKKVGFEAAHVTVDQLEWLKKGLPDVEWVPTRGLVEAQRLVKDTVERDAMRQAAKITDQAFARLLPRIRPGAREDALAADLEHEMRRLGAEGASFETIVASGWRAALPHGVASEKRVQVGDMIVFDFGCKYAGYCSDMSRTVVIGKPSALQAKVYGLVLKAQLAGLKAIKPGKTTGDVDKASRDVIDKSGYGKTFGHGTGHGVGREVHEEPRVGPRAPDKLRPGMAITVEPGIYLAGKFGVRIEDLAFVTRTGHENLYTTTKDLIVL